MAHHWRQALHLEPPTGWLNDPNGLCFYGGQYHVFFQSCPTAADGSGPKCWGHYVGRDLLHWQYKGTPLCPDTPYDRDGAYSGCAVPTKNELYLFYTGNVKEPGDHDYINSGRGANVLRVASADGGAMGKKRLVLQNADYPAFCSCHVRDPKIGRDADGWRMVLGARTRDGEGCVLVYRSNDLEVWRYAGCVRPQTPFGYMWECPDAFAVDGREILSVSPQGLPHEKTRFQNVYQSGWFPVTGALPGGALGKFTEWDMGFDFYAPQSFLAPDGRRLLLGWMGMPDAAYQNPTAPLGWQHCLTLPRELFGDAKGRLCQRPARELLQLRGEARALAPGETFCVGLPAELTARPTGSFALTMAGGLELFWQQEEGLCTLRFIDAALGGGRTVRRARLAACCSLRVIADTSSVEFYLDDGACVFSTRFYPAPGPVTMQLFGTAGTLYDLQPMEVKTNG